MNKVILNGRLVKDPELKYTSTKDTALCYFTIAVDRKFKKEGEEQTADFINIIAWSKTAEFINKYFTKGKKILLSGRIQVRSWDDDSGNKRWATDVIAEEVEFGESKNSGDPNQTNQVAQKKDSEGFAPLNIDDDCPF